METTAVADAETVPQKIVKVPAEVGTAIVKGTETVGHDVAKGVVEGGTVVVDATKTVVSDIAEAGKQLGREAKKVVSPLPEPLTPVAVAAAPAA
jgi:hypothetical protein